MISEKMGSSPRKTMAYKYICFMVLLKQHKKNMVIELTLKLVITCYNEVQVAHGDLVLASSAHSV